MRFDKSEIKLRRFDCTKNLYDFLNIPSRNQRSIKGKQFRSNEMITNLVPLIYAKITYKERIYNEQYM